MLPKSCLNRAIEDTYSFLRLSICVNSKRVEIDNSRMENTIRSLVLKERTICSTRMMYSHIRLTLL